VHWTFPELSNSSSLPGRAGGPPNDARRRIATFSSHIADGIPFENKKAIEDLACYLVRAPLSLQKLVYLDGQQAVLYRSRMNPSLGRNFEAMDPLEWLARLADHIPDPGRHRTHFYAHYANRVRGERPDEEAGRHADEAEPTTRRRCPPSWARLIAKVFQVDPLVCRRCGGLLKAVAYITDSLAIRQILEHLDLSLRLTSWGVVTMIAPESGTL
jgi:hypothetical protein